MLALLLLLVFCVLLGFFFVEFEVEEKSYHSEGIVQHWYHAGNCYYMNSSS